MQHSTKNTTVLTFLAISITIGLSACSRPEVANVHADINQSEVCEVSDWQGDVTAKVCKQGQKVVFLPQSFGNEQLPILFAAVNCDLRYSVALTNGGVTCIYSPLKPAEKKQEPASGSSKP
jgi:hypothetical protein